MICFESIFTFVLLLCSVIVVYFFFFKQKTAYEMRISDWSSDVCSSDLPARRPRRVDRRDQAVHLPQPARPDRHGDLAELCDPARHGRRPDAVRGLARPHQAPENGPGDLRARPPPALLDARPAAEDAVLSVASLHQRPGPDRKSTR